MKRPEIAFRPLQQSEIAQAARLWHSGWIDGHAAFAPPELARLRTFESFTARLTRDLAHARAAVLDGGLIGFTILKGNDVDQFYVAAQARGTGAAMALMADAEAQLRAAGHASAWLACSVGNTRAARFYEKAGWHLAATEPMSFETTEGPFTLETWRYEKAL